MKVEHVKLCREYGILDHDSPDAYPRLVDALNRALNPNGIRGPAVPLERHRSLVLAVTASTSLEAAFVAHADAYEIDIQSVRNDWHATVKLRAESALGQPSTYYFHADRYKK